MKYLSLLTALAISFVLIADEQYKPSSLIVPQGVSFRFSPIRLTRDVNITHGQFDVTKVRSKGSAGMRAEADQEHSTNEDNSSRDAKTSKNYGASVKAGVTMGFVPTLDAEAHAGYEKNILSEHRTGRSFQGSRDVQDSATNSFRTVDASEDRVKGQYGNYYLTFSMTLKNLDINDSYSAKRSDGAPLQVVVHGLSQPVVVPYRERQSFTFDVDEVICNFQQVVTDERLLAELQALESSGGLTNLVPSISGSDFPIISSSTGKNVLQEMKIVEMKNPTTEIALDFGEAKVLSPWRVKQRHGRASGKRGQLVTLREALEAVNAVVAEDDSMPERIFEFDKQSNLCSVCDFAVGAFTPGVEIWPEIKIGNESYPTLGNAELNKPLKAYKQITFSNIRQDERASANYWKRLIETGDMDKLVSYIKGKGLCFDEDNFSILHWIVMNGTKEQLEQVISSTGIDVDLCRNHVGPALEVAAMCNNVDMCKVLVAHGANLNYNIDKSGWKTAIEEAAGMGALAAVKYLLSKGADIHNAPIFAADEGRKDCLAYFIDEKKVDVKKIYDLGGKRGRDDVLYAAIKGGCVEVVRYLISEGVDLANPPLSDWVSPMQLACRCGNAGMVELFLSNGIRPNRSQMVALLRKTASDDVIKSLSERMGIYDVIAASVLSDNTNCLAKLSLRILKSVDRVYSFGAEDAPSNSTLLAAAAWWGAENSVRWLVEHGADVNFVPNEDEDLPIENAGWRGHLGVARYLLCERHAMLRNVAYYAICNGQVEFLDWLTSVKDDDRLLVDPKTYDGIYGSLMAYAAAKDQVEVCSLLRRKGADVNYRPEANSYSPVERASRNDAVRALRYLLEDAHAEKGQAITYAAECGALKCLKYFIEDVRVGVNYMDDCGGAPLLATAAGNGKRDAVVYLLDHGADADYAPVLPNGTRMYSAIERARNSKNDELVDLLISRRGSNVTNPPIKVEFRTSIGSTESNQSYVMIINNTSDKSLSIGVYRGGDKIKDVSLSAYASTELGWLELDRSFRIGDAGYLQAYEYPRKFYYEFTSDGKMSWRYDD